VEHRAAERLQPASDGAKPEAKFEALDDDGNQQESGDGDARWKSRTRRGGETSFGTLSIVKK
jgi:hypothetical protein